MKEESIIGKNFEAMVSFNDKPSEITNIKVIDKILVYSYGKRINYVVEVIEDNSKRGKIAIISPSDLITII